jgi:acyl-CoA synthetase (AMP-forming)/AMP-acid ligase II
MSERIETPRTGTVLVRALWRAGLLRPTSPLRLARAVRAGRVLHATPAASIAIAAALDPHAPGVIDEAGQVTWRELDLRTRAIAAALASGAGVGPERSLAIMCRNHRGAIEALAAAAHAGADALLLNTELTGVQIEKVLGGHAVGAIVADAEFADRLDAGAPAIPRFLAWHEGASGVPTLDSLATLQRRLDPPARRSRIVILTSGTTGTPKSAARDVPPRAMVGPLVAMIETFGLRRGEPVLVAPPLFHGFGLGIAMAAHGLGAPIVLRRRFDGSDALADIARHRVGCMVGVPVMLERMLAAGPGGRDLSSLRAVVSAGAPLSPDLSGRFMDAFGDILCNGYGTTETGFGAYATPADLRAAPGTVGRAPLGTAIHVLGEDRRPVAPGQTGHIFIGGDLVFDGYEGGGTKESVGRLMNTGDLGYLDAAGRLFIDGREDDMIVSGGENVFPGEVEDALATHPAVADAAAIGVDDAEFGQRLRAFVVAAPESSPSEAELLAHLRERLERYKLPREIVFCEEIPRNATGKTLRRVLAEG